MSADFHWTTRYYILAILTAGTPPFSCISLAPTTSILYILDATKFYIQSGENKSNGSLVHKETNKHPWGKNCDNAAEAVKSCSNCVCVEHHTVTNWCIKNKSITFTIKNITNTRVCALHTQWGHPVALLREGNYVINPKILMNNSNNEASDKDIQAITIIAHI